LIPEAGTVTQAIQVSDCPDWETVVRALAQAWNEAPAGEGFKNWRDMSSCRFISEEAVSRNGVEGWQLEVAANLQGKELYILHWIVATNGFGYILNTWGHPLRKELIKQEANRMFSEFKPIKTTSTP
jgi:hypothetical protein